MHVLSLLFLALLTNAEVTIYTQIAFGTETPTTTTKAWPTLTNAAAYDPVVLTPPAAPNPAVGGASVVQLVTGGMNNMSLPVPPGFVGFSVELSVCDQVLGSNGTYINPEFLNLMQTISKRSGRAVVRIGGNSQEKAFFFPEGLANGKTIIKDKSKTSNPTDTPELQVGVGLLYAMANISDLTNTDWYIGVPFNTSSPRLGIGESSTRILGKRLLGIQVGNEPDLYASHGDRNATYNENAYIAEMQQMVALMQADSSLAGFKIIIPNTCCEWGPVELQQKGGFMDIFKDNMDFLSVENYPNNNCKDEEGNRKNGQDYFESYLSHGPVQSFVGKWSSVSELAQNYNKELVMMETNTASCGGFPGLSDSFGASLWIIDATMQMAFFNFSRALLHVGGQNTYYNPFTSPPGALLKKGGLWTVNAPYYSALIVNELIGSSGNAQVVDLFPNNGSPHTPGYAVYENSVPVRAIFLNYITDHSGANDYTAQIAIDGSGVGKPDASPAEIYVRWFTSASVSDKIPFYYANQTFGPVLGSNGIPQGNEFVETIACDTAINLCNVKIPAPGAAVIFFTKEALQKSTQAAEDTKFETTVTSVEMHNTATIDSQVLATSNGYGGKNQQIGSTSYGSSDAKAMKHALPGAMMLIYMSVGAFALGRNLVR